FPTDPLAPSPQSPAPLLQVFDTYIVFQTDSGVAIVDQHSAHERVLYERAMRQLTGDGATAQRLLLPLTLEFTAPELEAIDAHRARRARTTDGRSAPQGGARTEIREKLNAECGMRNFKEGSFAAVTSPPLTPVLVGPTAVGKTAVAAAWAECEPIGVVSADARQVYRGLDIGTAKPSGALLARVPHLGLDVVEPGERYSAGRFARDAAQWLGQIRDAGRHPVVVGGTGLYVRALAEGLFHEPPLDQARRERLRAWAAALTPTRLAHWAARLDRRFAGGGRQRAGRAVEVALLTGRGLSWWQEHARETGAMRPWYIQLSLPRDVLHRRIAQRVDEMLAKGLVDELRRILA